MLFNELVESSSLEIADCQRRENKAREKLLEAYLILHNILLEQGFYKKYYVAVNDTWLTVSELIYTENKYKIPIKASPFGEVISVNFETNIETKSIKVSLLRGIYSQDLISIEMGMIASHLWGKKQKIPDYLPTRLTDFINAELAGRIDKLNKSLAR